MNTNQPKPAPTAEEQLPPLTISFGAQGEAWIATNMPSVIQAAPARVEKYVPETQLLDALRANREKDAQLADYEKLVLEKVIELGIAPSPEHENEWRNVRAEAAEASLRAVSEAAIKYCSEGRVDCLLARIREAIRC